MNPCSLTFLLALALGAAVLHAVARPGAKRLLLSAFNLAFLATFLPNRASAAWLAAAILASYGVLVLARRGAPRAVLVALAACLIGGFLVAKKYVFIAPFVPRSVLAHSIELIGLSYMLFKLLHVLVDVAERQPLALDLYTYASYQLAFFTLIAGPIQRYEEFHAFWWSMGDEPLTADASLEAWDRVFTGMLKMGVVGTAAYAVYTSASEGFLTAGSTGALVLRFAALFYAYPVYLYFNFSGYTDVVLGSARLMGFRLPENFDRPYLARNLVDFWNRWHMSLSSWIRGYVFLPSYKWAVGRWGAAAQTRGYVLMFLSLLLAGVWHGSTWNFVVFGAVHGAGAATSQAYGDLLKRRLSRERLARYRESRLVTACARLTTFHVVCFSFLFFPVELGTALQRLRAVIGAVR